MTIGRAPVQAPAPDVVPDASMKGIFVRVLLVQAATLTVLWLFQAHFTR